jgi:hypothetical protein
MTIKDLIHNLLKFDESNEVYIFHGPLPYDYTKVEGTNDEDDDNGKRIVVIS